MRVGKRKQPSYRVVVADARSARGGRIIESIGHYQPRREPSDIAIDSDRAVYWLKRGAQPSGPVRKLLELTGAWSAFTGQEMPPAESARPARTKATPAASVAGSTASESEVATGEPPAELPEALDQAAAAPEGPGGEGAESQA